MLLAQNISPGHLPRRYKAVLLVFGVSSHAYDCHREFGLREQLVKLHPLELKEHDFVRLAIERINGGEVVSARSDLPTRLCLTAKRIFETWRDGFIKGEEKDVLQTLNLKQLNLKQHTGDLTKEKLEKLEVVVGANLKIGDETVPNIRTVRVFENITDALRGNDKSDVTLEPNSPLIKIRTSSWIRVDDNTKIQFLNVEREDMDQERTLMHFLSCSNGCFPCWHFQAAYMRTSNDPIFDEREKISTFMDRSKYWRNKFYDNIEVLASQVGGDVANTSHAFRCVQAGGGRAGTSQRRRRRSRPNQTAVHFRHVCDRRKPRG